jgi:hypothetical protein
MVPDGGWPGLGAWDARAEPPTRPPPLLGPTDDQPLESRIVGAWGPAYRFDRNLDVDHRRAILECPATVVGVQRRRRHSEPGQRRLTRRTATQAYTAKRHGDELLRTGVPRNGGSDMGRHDVRARATPGNAPFLQRVR